MFGSLATLTDDGVASPHILNKEDPTVEEWGVLSVTLRPFDYSRVLICARKFSLADSFLEAPMTPHILIALLALPADGPSRAQG